MEQRDGVMGEGEMNGRVAKATRKAARAAVAERPMSELEKYAGAMTLWAEERGKRISVTAPKRRFRRSSGNRIRLVLVLKDDDEGR